jgi:hypothetical protein
MCASGLFLVKIAHTPPQGYSAPMFTEKTIARVENASWTLLYGGLLTLVLGLFTQRADDDLGLALVVWGGIAAALGAVLIYLRSRMNSHQK